MNEFITIDERISNLEHAIKLYKDCEDGHSKVMVTVITKRLGELRAKKD